MYGSVQSGGYPPCHSRVDRFDSESRECRGCGFQVSCRESVMKQIANSQKTVPVMPQAAIPYHQQFQTQPYAAPQPVHMSTVPAPVQQPMPMQQWAPTPQIRTVPQAPQTSMYQRPQTQPAPQQMQPPVQQWTQQPPTQAPMDWYGRVADPLFNTMMAAPPPFRPQTFGETFWERVGKNILLDLGTLACFHFGLAFRQLLFPAQPAQPKPTTSVVEGHVSPRR